jgi:lipoic acid synthetase
MEEVPLVQYNKAVKLLNPDTTLETLIPDFKGKKDDISRIVDAAPEVVSHNKKRLNDSPGRCAFS